MKIWSAAQSGSAVSLAASCVQSSTSTFFQLRVWFRALVHIGYVWLTYAGTRRTLAFYVLSAQIFMPFPRTPHVSPLVMTRSEAPTGGSTGMLKNKSSIRAVPRSLSWNRTYISDVSVEVRRSGGVDSSPPEWLYGSSGKRLCHQVDLGDGDRMR